MPVPAPSEPVAPSSLTVEPPARVAAAEPRPPDHHEPVAPGDVDAEPASGAVAVAHSETSDAREPRSAANGADREAVGGCTAPQLRRFIKSRPYVPMHELRRRFGINGHDDDVTAVDLGQGRVYVGLPPREGALLGELLRGGEIGYELSLDPRSPIVVGLYPMRPIARG